MRSPRAKEKQLDGSDRLIASLQLHHCCPHKLLPVHEACLIHFTDRESTCSLLDITLYAHTIKLVAEQATLICAAAWQITRHDAPTGRVFLTDSSATAPRTRADGSIERRQRPLSCPVCAIGRAEAIEDAELKNAWFPTQLAWDSFNFPSQAVQTSPSHSTMKPANHIFPPAAPRHNLPLQPGTRSHSF